MTEIASLQTGRRVTVSYASTVTPNSDTTDLLTVGALSGNLTLANPSGTPSDWQVMAIRLTATGADRTVTLGSAYQLPATTILDNPFTVTSGTSTIVAIQWNATASKWWVVAISSGF